MLAANAGNTALKLGLFEDGQLIWRQVIPNSELDAGLIALPDSPRPELLLSGSVRPASQAAVEALADQQELRALTVDRTQLRVVNRTEAPERVGLDRLLNARAALARDSVEWLVLDCGTAITCDRVSAAGEFVGGAIAPGAGLSARALHEGTALLPHVELGTSASVVGRNTEEALAAGLYWGFRGMIGKLAARMCEEAGEALQILITGGDGELLATELPNALFVADLTLEGILAYHADVHGG